MAEQSSKKKQNGADADSPSKSSKNSKNPNPRLRIYLLAGFLFLWLCAIGYRLVVLQVVRYGEFTQRASRQQQRTVEVSPRRGIIYDRNGHELAMTINVDSVFAVPSEIPDQATTASLIAQVLKVEPKEVLTKIQGSHNFSWIARKLDAEDSNRIRALNLKGIYFQKESKRFYPKRELAAQVLGYVGLDDEGLGGIERSFDEQMRGRPGKMLVSVDARQRSLGRVEKQPESGQNIVLTIDEKIQYIAEREFDRAMAESHAEAGTVVVQNPHTGEILALASRPTFNPNAFRTSTPLALKNRAVSDIYEPGSTFKIVTLSAALEEKLTRPDEVIDCQMGSIMVFGRKVHDHKPFGNLTVSQVLQKSSDVGAIKLGLRLGDQRISRVHSRIRVRYTDRTRTPGRDSRHGQACEPMDEVQHWVDRYGARGRRFICAIGLDGFDDRERWCLHSAAHCGRLHRPPCNIADCCIQACATASSGFVTHSS